MLKFVLLVAAVVLIGFGVYHLLAYIAPSVAKSVWSWFTSTSKRLDALEAAVFHKSGSGTTGTTGA